jgi:hypothetical protein
VTSECDLEAVPFLLLSPEFAISSFPFGDTVAPPAHPRTPRADSISCTAPGEIEELRPPGRLVLPAKFHLDLIVGISSPTASGAATEVLRT